MVPGVGITESSPGPTTLQTLSFHVPQDSAIDVITTFSAAVWRVLLLLDLVFSSD